MTRPGFVLEVDDRTPPLVVHEGKVGSLRRFKDDVSEVKAGSECGISLERFNDIKVGDVIELYTIEKIAAVATA